MNDLTDLLTEMIECRPIYFVIVVNCHHSDESFNLWVMLKIYWARMFAMCVCVSLWTLFSMHSFGLSTYQQWLLWANLNIKQMKSEFGLDTTPQTHQRCCLRKKLSLIRWLANIFVQVSVPMCTSCTSHRSAYLRCDNKNHTIHSGGLFHFGLSFGRVDKLVSLWWLNKRYEKTIKYFWSFNIRHR